MSRRAMILLFYCVFILALVGLIQASIEAAAQDHQPESGFQVATTGLVEQDRGTQLLFENQFPSVIEANPAVQAMMDQVLSSTIRLYDGQLSGEWPILVANQPYTIETRFYHSQEPIQKATQFVGQHLADLGLTVEYHEWDIELYAESNPNVIGEMLGQNNGQINPDQIVIISAHLDSVNRDDQNHAPGADDNASGSTAVLIAADILSQYSCDYTLRFAFWNGEERGLLGSRAYAQRAAGAGENIVGVLNLDMIGWNTIGSDPDMDLHARASLPESLAMAQLFESVVDVYDLKLAPEIIPEGTIYSDHAAFWEQNYPAILAIEDYYQAGNPSLRGDFNPYYHTGGDLLSQLDIDYFTEMVKAAVSTFAYMGNCLLEREDPLYYLPVVLSSPS